MDFPYIHDILSVEEKDKIVKSNISKAIAKQTNVLVIDLNCIIKDVYYNTWHNPNYIRENIKDMPIIEGDHSKYSYFCYKITDTIRTLTTYCKPNTLVLLCNGRLPVHTLQRERVDLYRDDKYSDIVPGSPLLLLLDNHIYQWLSRSQAYPDPRGIVLPGHVIYNSYKNPGDFVYKTVELFKSNIFSEGVNILYSSNPNSIAACLISSVVNLYLMYQNVNIILDMRVYRDIIESKNINIFDYVDICNLIATNMLPNRHKIKVKNVISYYHNIKSESVGRILSDQNGILWYNMSKIIKLIAENEDSLLTSNITTNRLLLYPSKVLELSIVKEQTEDNSEKIDYSVYRDNYYKHHINMKGDQTQLEKLNNSTINISYDELDIKDRCIHFLKIQAYIHNLFFGIGVDWCIYYPYHHLPLFRDIHQQLSDMDSDELRAINNVKAINAYYKGNFNLLHQLLAIIPTQKCDLLPSTIRHIPCEYSELSDMYPSKYFSDKDGINDEKESEAIIPFSNIDRIVLQTTNIYFPQHIRYEDDNILTEFIFKYKKAVLYAKSNIKGYLFV